MNFYFLIFISIFETLHFNKISKLCYKYDNELIIKNFDKNDYINISQCYLNESIVRIVSNQKSVINSNILMDLEENNIERLVQIEVIKFKGIDLSSKIFQSPIDIDYPSISARQIQFDFYKQNEIISEKDCNSVIIFDSFEAVFKNLQQIFSLTDCVYKQNICAFVFKNSFIKYLKFDYFYKSSLKKNYLQFTTDMVLNSTLNSQILSVEFNELFWIDLNLNLFNKQVFKKTLNLAILGSINNIQSDIFSYFNRIENIEFTLTNLEGFLHKGLNWTKFIKNYKRKVRLNFNNYPTIFSNLYEYPEEDWCLFQNSINNQNIMIYSELESYQLNKSRNLSCVLIGFLGNHGLHELFSLDWFKDFCNSSLNYYISLLEKCNKISCYNRINVSSNDLIDYYDFKKAFYDLESTFEFILDPVISVTGILSNLLIIHVMKKRQFKKDFKEKMYLYIWYNSIFNIAILLLDVIEYFNKCNQYSDLICPVFYETIFSQYIFIVFNFLKFFLQFCSNFTILFFSIERSANLINFDSKHSMRLMLFVENHFLKILFSFGLAFSIVKLFEYKINEMYIDSEFPSQLHVTDDLNGHNFIIILLIIFITDLVSNFFIGILNLVVDIQMFFKYRKIIKEKIRLSTILLNSSKGKPSIENNLLKYIILFSSINFIFRLPELILFFISKYFNLKNMLAIFIPILDTSKLNFSALNEFEDFCFFKKNCQKLLKTSQTIFKISFVSNIFVLFFTNKTFKKKMKIYFSCLKQNIKPKSF